MLALQSDIQIKEASLKESQANVRKLLSDVQTKDQDLDTTRAQLNTAAKEVRQLPAPACLSAYAPGCVACMPLKRRPSRESACVLHTRKACMQQRWRGLFVNVYHCHAGCVSAQVADLKHELQVLRAESQQMQTKLQADVNMLQQQVCVCVCVCVSPSISISCPYLRARNHPS